MSLQPLIEIRNLKKVYQVPGGEVVALDGISLRIEKGEIYGIIGMSGAGKSTLIRCMNKLDIPNDGQILIDGQDILAMNGKQLMAARRKMSMIFQQFNLLMQKTVARNVRYPLEIAGVPKNKANARVKELLKLVELESKADAYPIQLSGGQRQRVAIARALASNPEVLLCDEATSALDPMTTQSILALLQDINKRLGITVVLITHEMAVIRQICSAAASPRRARWMTCSCIPGPPRASGCSASCLPRRTMWCPMCRRCASYLRAAGKACPSLPGL